MEHQGVMGTAVQLRTDRLEADPNHTADTTVTYWLLTGRWHPLWPQFVLTVMSLRPNPGSPDPILNFPGATHELLVIALHPDDGPRTPDLMERRGIGRYLRPVDVVHQFEATDDEMRELAGLLAAACVHGQLTPSTDDAREQLREAWLGTCVRTLAHMRGEEHAHD